MAGFHKAVIRIILQCLRRKAHLPILQDLSANRELTSQAVKKIYAELTKGQKRPNRKITPEQIGEAVAQSVSHLPGVDTELVKQMFLAMAGTVTSNEKGSNDQ